MNFIFPAILHGWTQLLGSLAPLLLALLTFSATAFLLTFPPAARTPQRKQSDAFLASGNLLAITCWVLVYADRLALLQQTWTATAAPLTALATLLLLPAAGWGIALRHRQLQLKLPGKMIYGFSLAFQLLSLSPGLYLLTFYLVLFTGSA